MVVIYKNVWSFDKIKKKPVYEMYKLTQTQTVVQMGGGGGGVKTPPGFLFC